MSAAEIHRLDGLEPDNLLAFLALLGLLRALEFSADRARPRVSWSLDALPLRPLLHLGQSVDESALAERVASGIDALAEVHDFGGRLDLNYPPTECRALLKDAAFNASVGERARADLLAALMSDGAIREAKSPEVDPTPLCLLSGQGHQHFLARLAEVPRTGVPPARGRGRNAATVSADHCIAQALFHRWHREDQTPSFRWDPQEDVRYAMMAGDPTDRAFKPGTQLGANRLAVIGLATLTVTSEERAGRARAQTIGGARDARGYSFAWPIWREPTSLAGIRAMLTHPGLRVPGALRHLGIDHVLISRRISVGRYMNFTRARPLD